MMGVLTAIIVGAIDRRKRPSSLVSETFDDSSGPKEDPRVDVMISVDRVLDAAIISLLFLSDFTPNDFFPLPSPPFDLDPGVVVVVVVVVAPVEVFGALLLGGGALADEGGRGAQTGAVTVFLDGFSSFFSSTFELVGLVSLAPLLAGGGADFVLSGELSGGKLKAKVIAANCPYVLVRVLSNVGI